MPSRPATAISFFTSSSTALLQTIRVWERRSISRRISIPALCSSGTLSFKNNGRYVYTRNQLLDEVWGFDYFGDSRTVDVHIDRKSTRLNSSHRT